MFAVTAGLSLGLPLRCQCVAARDGVAVSTFKLGASFGDTGVLGGGVYLACVLGGPLFLCRLMFGDPVGFRLLSGESFGAFLRPPSPSLRSL